MNNYLVFHYLHILFVLILIADRLQDPFKNDIEDLAVTHFVCSCAQESHEMLLGYFPTDLSPSLSPNSLSGSPVDNNKNNDDDDLRGCRQMRSMSTNSSCENTITFTSPTYTSERPSDEEDSPSTSSPDTDDREEPFQFGIEVSKSTLG